MGGRLLCFLFSNWELELILFVGGVLLIVNFSRRNLVAIAVLNFWQGLELHRLLFLCNYRCKKSPHPVFVQNSSSEYYINIFYIIIKQELKDYGTIRMKAVKLVIVFEKA